MPSWTREPAATIPYTIAPSLIVDPIPINASSPIVHPYKLEFGPTKELLPTVIVLVAFMYTLSYINAFFPTVIELLSALNVAPYQIDELSNQLPNLTFILK